MTFGYDAFDGLDFVDERLDELFERGGSRVMIRLDDSSYFESYQNREGLEMVYDVVNHPEVNEDRLPGGRLPAEIEVGEDTVVAEPLGSMSYRLELGGIDEAAELCDNYPVEAIEAKRPIPEN